MWLLFLTYQMAFYVPSPVLVLLHVTAGVVTRTVVMVVKAAFCMWLL